MKRRDAIKIGLLAGGAGVLAPDSARAQDANEDLLKYLCPPDGFPDELTYVPSPPAATFEAPLFVPPIMTPVDTLTPPPQVVAQEGQGLSRRTRLVRRKGSPERGRDSQHRQEVCTHQGPEDRLGALPTREVLLLESDGRHALEGVVVVSPVREVGQ